MENARIWFFGVRNEGEFFLPLANASLPVIRVY
jgi:hypothetical protein